MEQVLLELRKRGNLADVEYGKNWVHVLYENEEASRNCLKMNCSVIGGEMIGVVRRRKLICDEKEIFVTRKGIFSKVYEYLFGS
jgi:hypothetical protein